MGMVDMAVVLSAAMAGGMLGMINMEIIFLVAMAARRLLPVIVGDSDTEEPTALTEEAAVAAGTEAVPEDLVVQVIQAQMTTMSEVEADPLISADMDPYRYVTLIPKQEMSKCQVLMAVL